MCLNWGALLPAQMSSESCANKSGLETSVVTALCTVSMPLVLNVVVGFFVVFLNPLENKSYTSIRTEALSVIKLLLTKLQGETSCLPPGRATGW